MNYYNARRMRNDREKIPRGRKKIVAKYVTYRVTLRYYVNGIETLAGTRKEREMSAESSDLLPLPAAKILRVKCHTIGEIRFARRDRIISTC